MSLAKDLPVVSSLGVAPMRWPDFRKLHPDAWIIVEVLAAREIKGDEPETDADADVDAQYRNVVRISRPRIARSGKRLLDRIRVLEVCADAGATVRRYRELRRTEPTRELCFLHTAWDAEIEERWEFSRELHDTLVTTA